MTDGEYYIHHLFFTYKNYVLFSYASHLSLIFINIPLTFKYKHDGKEKQENVKIRKFKIRKCISLTKCTLGYITI